MALYDNSPQAILPRFPPGSILATQNWVITYIQNLIDNGEISGIGAQYSGDGDPEGVKVANIGDIYWDTTNLILYVKNTDSGAATGWQAH